MTRRGDLFRKAGVQDLASYRREGSGFRVQGSGGKDAASASALNPEPGTLNPRMPRTLLIIDEFQEFFSEDDKLAQDAAVLLDRLLGQRPAVWGPLVLGGPKIGGGSGGGGRTNGGKGRPRAPPNRGEGSPPLPRGQKP